MEILRTLEILSIQNRSGTENCVILTKFFFIGNIELFILTLGRNANINLCRSATTSKVLKKKNKVCKVIVKIM